MREPVCAYIAVGANVGDARQAACNAIAAIGRLPGVALRRQSSLYRTAPLDSSGPDYVNAVVEVATRLTAPELLALLQRLETEAGRERPYRNAPRTLDLDLLLYGTGRIDSAVLVVPHPRMRERAFVLVPLAEIAPSRVSTDELARVASQRIEALPPASLVP
ncbi:MAG TPA: 2-amino-4-hydroxy-6-hydroxymethyldihydropteridine diphosphokinase [Ramlibacter sp.]|uniref:2-amino-4-hydroxy-6- hydroxymethyldihydropteridine diphosphokinase n=1 Tax=Ramlibacter sp. TaxID=1917967 RepID=UPI002C6FEE89|nr:2-amino-4-hydroxy-6-hydroxymethyldihydropteridine diphosphokinase [Ramlibacter sp.]HVZ42408.1 2-amino-4-hydroxy-6-hydroxymethyldihydropteridine diphosphokinase [Ramlibacter sp.]